MYILISASNTVMQLKYSSVDFYPGLPHIFTPALMEVNGSCFCALIVNTCTMKAYQVDGVHVSTREHKHLVMVVEVTQYSVHGVPQITHARYFVFTLEMIK